jgi:hypothetical protein
MQTLVPKTSLAPQTRACIVMRSLARSSAIVISTDGKSLGSGSQAVRFALTACDVPEGLPRGGQNLAAAGGKSGGSGGRGAGPSTDGVGGGTNQTRASCGPSARSVRSTVSTKAPNESSRTAGRFLASKAAAYDCPFCGFYATGEAIRVQCGRRFRTQVSRTLLMKLHDRPTGRWVRKGTRRCALKSATRARTSAPARRPDGQCGAP